MGAERLGFLAQVATWYYEDDLTQGEIADRINLSRSMVSRLLREAREQGLVEIRVRYPLKPDRALEKRLCQTFSVSEAIVLADPPANEAIRLSCLGEMGAYRLQRQLHDGIRIGVGWGTSVYELVHAMDYLPIPQATVVQVIGSIGSGDPTVDGSEMVHCLAEKLNAASYTLHAPLIVEDEDTARSLLQNRPIRETLALASQSEVILLGVGTTDSEASGMRRAGYVTDGELAILHDNGAVGDILGWHLDPSGAPINHSINRRVIGIDLETLESIPTVIVAASGAAKVPAILATLLGGYPDVIITDAPTASSILVLHEEQIQRTAA